MYRIDIQSDVIAQIFLIWDSADDAHQALWLSDPLYLVRAWKA